MTFDYLNKEKTVLTSDGKRSDLILNKGFVDSSILKGLGQAGFLRGEARSDCLIFRSSRR